MNRNQSFQDGKHQRKGSGKSKDVHLFKQKAEYSLTGGTTIRTDVAAGKGSISGKMPCSQLFIPGFELTLNLHQRP